MSHFGFPCLFLLVIGITVISAHSPLLKNPKGFLSTHQSFAIPLDIYVGFIGLNGDGADRVAIHAENFATTLSNSLSSHSPRNHAPSSTLPQNLPIAYEFTYHVQHFASQHITSIETLLMKYAHMMDEKTDEGEIIYEIEIKDVEQVLDRIYGQELPSIISTSDKRPAEERAPYAVLIMNLDKNRMRPASIGEQPWIYRYRYHNGPPTRQWLSEHRYVVIDLSAGPCTYGSNDAHDGNVVATGMEKQGQSSHSSSLVFTSHLTSIVISAIRSVFAPDIRTPKTLKYAEKLVIPIIVMKNHRRFDPFLQVGGSDTLTSGSSGPINEFKIDMTTLHTEISRMLLPSQELLLVPVSHHLHDHHHLSTAVFTSLKGDTVYGITPDGTWKSKEIPYIASAVLMEQMKEAADSLVAGLIGNELPSSPLPELDFTESTTNKKRRSPLKSSLGHRILPVYVFSLLGLPHDVLLDRRYTTVADSRSVMVLQTGSSPIPLPYFTADGITSINPRTVTQSILSGIATSLGGLVHPHQTLNQHNWMWSMGHHPFGPFTTTSSLSQIHLDIILRNSIMTRTSAARTIIISAIDTLREFMYEYVSDHSGDIEYYETSYMVTRMLMGESSSTTSPLATRVMSRLSDDLTRMETQLTILANQMKLLRWGEANTLSTTILTMAKSFHRYVDTEIESARLKLQCCTKEYVLVQPWGWIDLILIISIFSLGIGLIFFISRSLLAQKPKSYTSHVRQQHLQRVQAGLKRY